MRVLPRPFGAVLGDAVNMLTRVWRPLLGTSLIVFIPLAVFTLVVFEVTGAAGFLDTVTSDPSSLDALSRDLLLEQAEPFFWAAGIVLAAQTLASLFLYLASHRIVAAELANRPISGREARMEAGSRFGPALIAAVIVVVVIAALFAAGLSVWLIPFMVVGTPNEASVLVALVLLVAVVAPAVWLAVSFSMMTSVLAIEDKGPIRSLRRSFELVRRRWWPTLGYLLVVGLLGSVAAQLIQILAIPLSLVGDAASGFAIASLVGVIFQGVVVAGIAVLYTGWYLDLRARVEDDFSTEDLWA